MRKIDVILGALIGFLNGVFFFFILKQIGKSFAYSWLILIFFPFLAASGLFIASIIGNKLPIIFQASKFFLVGTLNTFIDLAVLNFFIWISDISKGIFYVVFKTISFLAATTNSYFWNKFWTFSSSAQGFGGQGKKVVGREFGKFFIVTAFGLLINVGVASFIVNTIGPKFGITEKIWASVGAIVAAFFAFLWNFSGSKFIVFK